MYTRVARGQDRMEVKSTIDLVLVRKDLLHYVQDKGGERNGMRSLIPPFYTVKSQVNGGHGLRGER